MGLLDYVKQGAQNVWAGGAKPRSLVGGLLQGDTTQLQGILGELKQIADPSYMKKVKPMTTKEAMDMGMMALTTTGGKLADVIPKTKYELAHEIAQKNAVEMLGLPANNTAMDRAKALGFDTPAYHGTNSDITKADYKYSGGGNDQYGSAALYTGNNPSIANGYVKDNIDGGNVLPLMLNTKGFVSHNKKGALRLDQLKKIIESSPDEYALSNYGDVSYEGYNKVLKNAVDSYKSSPKDELLHQMNMVNNDFYSGSPEAFNSKITELTGIKGLNVDVGNGGKFYIPYNPADIRSRFAAFDPARAHEADLLGNASPELLAYIASGGLLGAGAYKYSQGDK